MELYDWQKEIVNHKGNIAVRGGRQCGKSWAGAYRIKKLIEEYPGCTILITSPSEKQELYLYEKVKTLFKATDFKKKPTLKHAIFKNKSQIFKFPVGKTGVMIEGLSSVDFLFIDEALHMTERSIDAIIPMTAEPRKRGLGWLNVFGTTRGRPKGFFYDCFKRDDFKTWHIRSEDVEHTDKKFLESEKLRLGERLYNMIYGGEWIETDYKFFDSEKIKEQMNIKEWKFNSNYDPNKTYILGIDPARFGKDWTVLAFGEIEGEKINIIYIEIIKKCSMDELFNNIEKWDRLFNFSGFYLDSFGGLVDFMRKRWRSKVIELNNSSRGRDGERLKEDLYFNLKNLIDFKLIRFINDQNIKESLESVEFDGEKFFGEKTDIAEAIIRAGWAIKQRRYEPRVF
jgi:hypothetical protein